MKRNARIQAAALLLCLLPLICAGCRKEDPTPLHGAEDASLTADNGGRYDPLTLVLPEGYSMPWDGGTARYDPASGSLSVAAQRFDGRELCSLGRAVFTFSSSGELTGRTDIPGDPAYSLGGAVFSGDSLWYILNGYGEDEGKELLCRMALSDGSLTMERELSSLPSMPDGFLVERMAADGDGDLWLTGGGLTLVYTPELDYVNTVRAGGWISCFAPDPEGSLWACSGYGGSVGWGAARLDKVSGSWEDAVSLDQNTRRISFSPAGDLYFETADGISVMRKGEDGKWEKAVPVLNFLASGIVRSSFGLVGGDETSELIAAAGDGLLFASLTTENGLSTLRPVLYHPAGEREAEPENVVTLQMAFAHEPPDPIRSEIVRFNRDHPDIQVTTLDYSIYNNAENVTGGADSLLTDMANGIVSPDIVYGDAQSRELLTLARRGMTADLMPYIEADDTVNPDNLFGSVLRYFDNGEGGLWGIAPYFSLNTWLSTPDLLGEYGGADGWSLSDFLDFAESLPEGRYLARNTVRGSYALLPVFSGQFVDQKAGVCTFDSPLFVRLLRFMDGLPEARELNAFLTGDKRTFYRDGTFSLASAYIWGAGNLLNWESQFSTRDYVIVGYPSEDPAYRTSLSASQAFVIPKTCPAPEAAWAFIRTTFRAVNEQSWFEDPGLSSLKSHYDEKAETMRGQIMIHLADGRWTNYPVPPEDYAKAEGDIKKEMKKICGDMPWTVEPPDEEQLARVRNYLDREGGAALDRPPQEVNDLIREEISAFLGGLGTAEDCAAKIQSRVSLWLAENG